MECRRGPLQPRVIRTTTVCSIIARQHGNRTRWIVRRNHSRLHYTTRRNHIPTTTRPHPTVRKPIYEWGTRYESSGASGPAEDPHRLQESNSRQAENPTEAPNRPASEPKRARFRSLSEPLFLSLDRTHPARITTLRLIGRDRHEVPTRSVAAASYTERRASH